VFGTVCSILILSPFKAETNVHYYHDMIVVKCIQEQYQVNKMQNLNVIFHTQPY
jgi:hypothetical protein